MKIEKQMFSHFIAYFYFRRLLQNKMIMMWDKVQVKSILIISDSKTAELTGGKRGQGRDQRIEMYLHELRKCTNNSQSANTITKLTNKLSHLKTPHFLRGILFAL